ncbi:tetratricopeptide repeat protein [Polaromonas sp. YR568]|uniref:L,D-transpeptidase Cds6 family protein n=1 Tax=Polaromonas sp. YR568 TaxID=1855301 RepID=UPI0031381E18
MRTPAIAPRLLLAIWYPIALVAALGTTAARADDYADVNRLMRAGQSAEAMVKVDQYLASKPRDPQMRFLKGVIQTEAGRANEAITTFIKITEDYPELPEPYNNLAVLYAGQNQYDKARAALEMAIRTNPSYATAHENLGDVYARLASQAYSKALQLDGANTGIPPKLSLIRTLFSVDSKVQARPASGAQASGPVTVAPPAATPAAKPAATAPVAPAPSAAPAAAPAAPTTKAPATEPTKAAPGTEKEVEAAVRAWADAWAAKDMPAYLASYSTSFDPPGNMDRKAWEQDRRLKITGKSRITVKLSNLSVSVQGNKASAKFKQDYSADTLNISSRKTLELSKSGARWQIIRESTGG